MTIDVDAVYEDGVLRPVAETIIPIRYKGSYEAKAAHALAHSHWIPLTSRIARMTSSG